MAPEDYIMVPLKSVYDAYNKQILEGPLKVMTALLEKEHFAACKDILPIVQDSLTEFEIPMTVVNEPEEAPMPSTLDSESVKILVSEIDKLTKAVDLLSDIFSKLPVAKAPEQAPTPEPESLPTEENKE